MNSYKALHIAMVVVCLIAVASISNAELIGDPVFPVINLETHTVTTPDGTAYTVDTGEEEFEWEFEDDGKWKIKGALQLGDSGITIEEIEFDPDPSVSYSILVQNTDTVPKDYSLSLPILTTFPADNIVSGSVVIGLIDLGSDGATVSSLPGSSIYNALIDGSPIASLLNSDSSVPYTLTAPGAQANAAIGNFGPTLSNVPVNSSMDILLEFTLSPGDELTVQSRFDVVAVPEPSSLALLLMACAGLAVCMRRR